MRNFLIRTIASTLILLGYIAVVLPFGIDQYSRIGQTTTITGYKNAVDRLTQEEREALLNRTKEYNKKIAEEQAEMPYEYDAYADIDEIYYELPISSELSKEMGTIIIDKINVNLSIGHGVSDEVLDVMAGHLYGTSLPTGDSTEDGAVPPSYGTHTVLSAHTGLRQAELFTRIDELDIGDSIKIRILNEDHYYEVDQIEVVLPEYANEYLQVEPNKDLLTLYTCTPYGQNTHRLLVRAHRVKAPEISQSGIKTYDNINIMPYVILAGLFIAPIILVIILNMLI